MIYFGTDLLTIEPTGASDLGAGHLTLDWLSTQERRSERVAAFGTGCTLVPARA